MVRDRSAHILEAAIAEFIGSGEPVSSQVLYDRYDFGIKPAMIRLELTELERDGYLEQPHHSAGRVPTDRGYAFYVDQLLHRSAIAHRNRELQHLALEAAWRDVAASLSRYLGVLSVVATDDELYKSGIERLIARSEWTNRDELAAIARDIERIDERIAAYRGEPTAGSGDVQVFIGDNPLTSSSQLATLVTAVDTQGTTYTILTVGPKRMNYAKGVDALRNLHSLFS